MQSIRPTNLLKNIKNRTLWLNKFNAFPSFNARKHTYRNGLRPASGIRSPGAQEFLYSDGVIPVWLLKNL